MESPNPYAPPQANVDVATDAGAVTIDSLDVPERWKRRFRAIHAAGGPRLPNAKALPFWERQRTMFNVFGFLFGPVYYLYLGMWKKALTLFVACVVVIVVIAIVLVMTGYGRYATALNYGAAALFGIRVNIDYYKKKVLLDNSWW